MSLFFFFKQKTAYELRISDWSSDVCSSDLEDSVLLRAGLTRLLLDAGEDVIASVGDADALLLAVERHQPDLAVVDVRMPPTNTDDGLRAALEIDRKSVV